MNGPPTAPPGPGTALLRDDATGDWLLFDRPESTITATRTADVLPALREVAAATDRGLFAAGFVAYDAARAFDPAFPAPRPAPTPLLHFTLHRAPNPVALPPPPAGPALPAWTPDTPRERYNEALARIRRYIAAGDTYQVNYTLRLRGPFPGDAWNLFLHLQHAQRAPFGAFIRAGDHTFCSASPELHFSLDGSRITCPAWETRPRGRWCAEDAALRAESGLAEGPRGKRHDCRHGAMTSAASPARLRRNSSL